MIYQELLSESSG